MCEHFPNIDYTEIPEDALEDSVATLIATVWDEIANLGEEFDLMLTPIVVDGRRAIDRREGIVY